MTTGGKKPSGAAKRKKKKEKERAIEQARADAERLKLGPTPIWRFLMRYKDIFVSHVLPKLTETDRYFFAEANGACKDLLEYAGVILSKIDSTVVECTSISTLELMWNNMVWGETCTHKNGQLCPCGTVKSQAWFCSLVAGTNKLELLKWIREEKKCEWDERTIDATSYLGNLEMLKYCFSHHCPFDEDESCCQAALGGHLDCLRFLFDTLENPSRKTERNVTLQATAHGHLNVLKYMIEERESREQSTFQCPTCGETASEEEQVLEWPYVAYARYYERTECLNYLREQGCPEPTDEQYASIFEQQRAAAKLESN